ncbi:DUF6047 family protein [Alistipes indistinctus]|uniref:DUF6047 family protein n=1 Tax=Alistipes indistinctus TaxID=626932 RepID=UPI003D7661D8
MIVDTTPRGSIVLEHTGYGNRCHRGYLQYLADHYFDPQHKDISSLETRVIRGCTPQLHPRTGRRVAADVQSGGLFPHTRTDRLQAMYSRRRASGARNAPLAFGS